MFRLKTVAKSSKEIALFCHSPEGLTEATSNWILLFCVVRSPQRPYSFDCQSCDAVTHGTVTSAQTTIPLSCLPCFFALLFFLCFVWAVVSVPLAVPVCSETAIVVAAFYLFIYSSLAWATFARFLFATAKSNFHCLIHELTRTVPLFSACNRN